MPNKQFFLSFEIFEKGFFALYARDLPAAGGVAEGMLAPASGRR